MMPARRSRIVPVLILVLLVDLEEGGRGGILTL